VFVCRNNNLRALDMVVEIKDDKSKTARQRLRLRNRCSLAVEAAATSTNSLEGEILAIWIGHASAELRAVGTDNAPQANHDESSRLLNPPRGN
jgi:hypothetical protein